MLSLLPFVSSTCLQTLGRERDLFVDAMNECCKLPSVPGAVLLSFSALGGGVLKDVRVAVFVIYLYRTAVAHEGPECHFSLS